MTLSISTTLAVECPSMWRRKSWQLRPSPRRRSAWRRPFSGREDLRFRPAASGRSILRTKGVIPFAMRRYTVFPPTGIRSVECAMMWWIDWPSDRCSRRSLSIVQGVSQDRWVPLCAFRSVRL